MHVCVCDGFFLQRNNVIILCVSGARGETRATREQRTTGQEGKNASNNPAPVPTNRKQELNITFRQPLTRDNGFSPVIAPNKSNDRFPRYLLT